MIEETYSILLKIGTKNLIMKQIRIITYVKNRQCNSVYSTITSVNLIQQLTLATKFIE